ncbi:MAG: T9SS type A sorting domain-containing protein, partial [Bacteroidales bacterium]|nr:T9SS type A sorting domain-containing protein [Bacteroidales bacterium]
ECYNEGKVVGETAGGIAGNLSGIGPRTVINCYNIADINASLASGGIVGVDMGKPLIKNCYNVGNISCDSIYAGGIIGLQNAQADTIVNSYYLNTCGAEGSGEAKTDDEMRDRAFVDLLNNETDVWCFDQNNVNHGYPILGFNDTNVAESQTETFGIYPNPAFTTLTVENGNATEISVFNALGQKIKQVTAHGEKTIIDVSDMPNGLYLIILGGKSASVTQRFIVTH